MSKEIPKDANTEIVRFIKGLVVEKGMEDLPPLYLSEFMADLYVRFQDMLMVNYADSLSKEDYYAFSDLVEGGEPQMVQDFVTNHGNMADVLNKTLDQFKTVVMK